MNACYYCDRNAEYYCDFVLAMAAMPKKPVTNDMPMDEFIDVVFNPDEIVQRTCDRPLCSKHRHQVGILFWDGDESGADSIDMCPGHAHVPDGNKPRPSKVGGGRAA